MKKLTLVLCATYAKEIKYVLEHLKIENVNIEIVSTICCKLNSSQKEAQISKFEGKHVFDTQVDVLMPPSCSAFCQNSKYNTTLSENCLELIIPKNILNYFIEKQYYIVSPGWLLQWKNILTKQWKFTEETANAFFKETAKEILVLDTGVYPDFTEKLNEFTNFINLPIYKLKVDLDYFQKKIENNLLKYANKNLEKELNDTKKEYGLQISEYAMIMDIIPILSNITSENEIIAKVFELFSMLFTPENIFYVKIQKNGQTEIIKLQASNYSDEQVLLKCKFEDKYVIFENNSSFIIKIIYDDELLGYLLIDKILFPQFLNKYLDLTLKFASYIGLVISNARQYEELTESKISIAQKNEDLKQKIEEITLLNEELYSSKQIIEKHEEDLKEEIASKDKLFSIISHDLRSPFNTILGFSNLLLKNIQQYPKEKIEQQVFHINRIASNTYKLLEDLLLWAKSQTGKIPFKPELIHFETDCNYVISSIFSLCESKNISINYNIRSDIHVFADRNMLNTILRNLLSNAIKFTNLGGNIQIKTENRPKCVVISITDNGIGIPPENIAGIFDISLKKSTEGTNGETGTGLGLSLCKEFVEKHSGKIWVESKPNVGSTFFFSLPKNTIKEYIEKPIKGLYNKYQTIAIVDDETINFIVLEEILNDLNFNIIYAKNGREIVELCQKNPCIDLIVMDIKMPFMNGVEAAKKIKLQRPELPIIAHTALVKEYGLENIETTDFDDFIAKPLDEKLFRQKIIKHLRVI